ncbi:putative predicted metal-dependent hydrolase [Lachnospiraceae bacterium KM106-2]|nr:putative predicted metal-dependent hydrolase [Lachnospiraceae bacterium KM106-2]
MTINNIKIHIVRKKIKNMYLTVHREDGSVEVKAPLGISEEQIERFVRSKMDWIMKHQEKFKNLEIVSTLQFEDGAKIPFLGSWYPLKIADHRWKDAVRLEDDILYVYMKDGYRKEYCQAIVEMWYREQLFAVMPALFAKWEQIMGVHAKEVRVRKMKTRWGTCNVRDHRIWMSLELAKKPIDCIEYIVVHELAHLIEPSHNKVFHGLMDRYMPDWKLRKQKLNEV